MGHSRHNLHAGWHRPLLILAGLLLCQVCPPGLESTMFALLAGCHNLGRSVASIFGTSLLTYLGVEPDGIVRDRHCFDRLWVVAVFQALAPLLTLCIIPSMIPNVSQTERLNLHGNSGDTGRLVDDMDPSLSMAAATSDSMWSSFCMWWVSGKALAQDQATSLRASLPEHAYGSMAQEASDLELICGNLHNWGPQHGYQYLTSLTFYRDSRKGQNYWKP